MLPLCRYPSVAYRKVGAIFGNASVSDYRVYRDLAISSELPTTRAERESNWPPMAY
jgi:hypothetical protein